MRPFLVLVSVALAAGCLEPEAGAGESPAPSPTATPAFKCAHAKSYRLGDVNATIDTSKGPIGIILHGAKSPVTVCNFLRYAEENFHDGTVWHRICTHVIQAGGYNPYAPPQTAQKPTHEPIKNEANESQLRNYKYTLGMARGTPPDSATSHFFVNLKDNNYLDFDGTYKPGYAVFGNVTSGHSVVDEIARSQTVPDLPPEAGPLYSGCQGRPAPSAETTIRDIRVDA